jgi:LuxR family transcriptional regulator, maltose regulon positive regulatory protein
VTDSPDERGTSSIVVKTKLLAPSSRSAHVLRSRLLEILAEGSDRKLTLVGAPAGYGKTTLLTQWRQYEKPNLPFVWVTLDEQDNDPVRLWRHVVEALRQVTFEEGWGADMLVGLGVIGTELVETTLPMLLNQLTRLPHRVVLVLDDYQCIKESKCHETVAFFIEHLPDTIHLVLSTRTDPPLPVGRLRARGEMIELRTEQLAFSEEETASLVNDRLRLNISRADLSVLLERTEGWPAGIYLAALTMRGKVNAHTLIKSLRGSSRYIVDLLGEEVLAGSSEEVKDFLLRTSVLEKLSGSLCDEVVGTEGSSKLLRELTHSNLFVVPLDDDGEWYRYHHLFADFLGYELKSTQPKLVPVLHGRASAWFEREGLIEAAIRHAIMAEEHVRAGTLVARYWFTGYVATGQTVTLVRWLDALPEDIVSGDPALILVKAWLSALYGRREESETFLELAEGFPLSIVEAAQRAAELETRQTSPWTPLVNLELGISFYYTGDISRARGPAEEALRLTKNNQPVLRLPMLFLLSLIATDEGHLEEAESLAREAGTVVERFRLQRIPQATLATIALGCVLAKRGDLVEARSDLESALAARSELSGLSPWPAVIGLLALASVRSASGDRAGARVVLNEARVILESLPDAGIFPELLERQERKLRRIKRRDGSLDGELTERELDVVRLLDGELSTQEMGRTLYVAPSTVRTHVKSIYRKLGVSSREEAVEQALTRKLI